MAFVVEDGTGLENATAYVSVEWVDGYFMDRQITTWVASYEKKQAAIISATDYVDLRFGKYFRGIRLDVYTQRTVKQALAFPRKEFYIDGIAIEGVPLILKKAIAEYALAGLTDRIVKSASSNADGEKVVKKEDSRVGSVQQSVEYDTTLKTSRYKKIPYADSLMESLVTSSGFNQIRTYK